MDLLTLVTLDVQLLTAGSVVMSPQISVFPSDPYALPAPIPICLLVTVCLAVFC